MEEGREGGREGRHTYLIQGTGEDVNDVRGRDGALGEGGVMLDRALVVRSSALSQVGVGA